MVYAREDKLCHVCSTPIIKIRQAGRGTFLCRICQK
ncbi:MAG: zinc finger domain-containing protein [Nitrosotalea sp.]